ncbi:MAG: hypothetical protein H0W35_02580 [Actinobacteria bacterium]|nr:hypothetical protein [Actinomycetota bacterium]MBA3561594.1 hypothetical protein [Actinomycetota bacterium]MBA3566475.1 hypothetical protein [Actinomycetota bacterium]MDQ3085485.1 hypothetical protein [Actinomycetota bacterium]MDQ3401698.1 hypothetical protein [Chloroflexota bacterium]
MADPSETTQVSLEPEDSEASELLEAVRGLSAQVGGLQAELNALRSQVRPLPELADAPGWGDSTSARRESSPWVRTLERPGPRSPAVPRLLIEIAFLAGVALAASIAELDPVVIVLVMAGAWVLVALAEWVATRAARRHAIVLAAPLSGAGAFFGEDPSWFGPSARRPAIATEDVDEDTQTGPPAPPAN